MKGEILSIDTVKRIADLEKRINKAIERLTLDGDVKVEDVIKVYDSAIIDAKNILKGSDNND